MQKILNFFTTCSPLTNTRDRQRVTFLKELTTVLMLMLCSRQKAILAVQQPGLQDPVKSSLTCENPLGNFFYLHSSPSLKVYNQAPHNPQGWFFCSDVLFPSFNKNTFCTENISGCWPFSPGPHHIQCCHWSSHTPHQKQQKYAERAARSTSKNKSVF